MNLQELLFEANKEQEKYQTWKKLVNMPTAELKKFIDSDLGKEAGLGRKEASEFGIKRGRDSARAIIRMRSKPFTQWDANDKAWMSRQISFISRMSGNKGPLMDDNGKPTRKLTSLWIWGHVPNGVKPTKYMNVED